eukprot:gene29135-36224_t
MVYIALDVKFHWTLYLIGRPVSLDVKRHWTPYLIGCRVSLDAVLNVIGRPVTLDAESWAVDWKLERQGQSSKISYLLRRLAKLGCERLDSEPATPVAEGSEGPVVPTVASARATRERRMSGQKIIIYSNFATHLHVVDLALNHEFGSRVYVSLFSRK